MPKLENPKHESFALNLAKGMKQGEAYVYAGYQSNASAASRLAASPYIVDRVTELEKEILTKMNTALTKPSEEAAKTLAEMGLTMDWVARAYKNIYNEALEAKSFAAANSAVASIQKLIEIDRSGGQGPEEEKAETVKLNEVTAFVSELNKMVRLGQKEGTDEEPMKDITPDGPTPTQVLATRTVADDTDN